MTVIRVKDNLPLFLRAVKQLTRNEVLVGVPSDGAPRRPEAGESAGADEATPLTNSDIAYLMETGQPEQNLPARPFLVPGVESIAGQAADRLKTAGKAVLTGDFAAVDRSLHTIGLIGQSAVHSQITDGEHAPLAASTLAKRRARGRTGTEPLIDTGQLRNAVVYVVRPKRG